MNLNESELGKKSAYKTTYDNSLLFPISRQIKRDELGLQNTDAFFYGYDLWTAYEVSWLDALGKPQVRIVKFIIDAHSTNIIESKSFKLYLNSFNNQCFESQQQVLDTLYNDITRAVEGEVSIQMYAIDDYPDPMTNKFDGQCLDQITCNITEYTTNANLLTSDTQKSPITESLYSHLLKSNCLVTNQPDWGSVFIQYTGSPINHESLLQYLISFRNHNEFHEQCVERIYTDIMEKCNPQHLSVYARYTRRGGLDINPLRSSDQNIKAFLPFINMRLSRQ